MSCFAGLISRCRANKDYNTSFAEDLDIFRYLRRNCGQSKKVSTLVLEYFSNILKKPTQIPYQVISHISNEDLKHFILKTLEAYGIDPNDAFQKQYMLTSCVNTAMFMSLLFCGQRVDAFTKVLLSVRGKTVNVNGTCIFITKNVIDGEANRRLLQLLFLNNLAPSFTPSSLFDNLLSLIYQETFKAHADQLDNLYKDSDPESIIAKIVKHDFKYNEKFMVDFEKLMGVNEKRVSQDTSFVYFVSVVGTENESIDHAMTIEQFLYHGKVRYRLYQSWGGEDTLPQDLELRLKPQEHHSWDKTQMLKIISDMTKDNSQKFENNFHIGTTVRCIFFPFNPVDVFKHFLAMSKD